VLEARPELRRPADLYLEGSDQHRGWFQSSLLTSVGAYDEPPFRAVLTHGFIVDGDGRKMSKSLGNTVSPIDVVAKSGADIIRLWAASADYGQDISVSDEILDRTSEAYRRIRNTFRFLLSNLSDFDPADSVSFGEMPELDRYALVTLSDLVRGVTAAYDDWRFHGVYRLLYEYCGADLSSFYLDVLKDRLYADAAGSVGRRSAQTVLASMLGAMVRMVAPILTFTSEEIWQLTPEALRGSAVSVQLAGWPDLAIDEGTAAPLRDAYATVRAVREDVTKALEDARGAGLVGKSQEAALTISASDDAVAVLAGRPALTDLFMVAAIDLRGGADSVTVEVARAAGEKCPRCWNIRTDIGSDAAHSDVCGRCATVLEHL
jgi:isoleucyl-tRNA synthetase